jgi:glycosyltransferase involved in cell wall biosynthesis
MRILVLHSELGVLRGGGENFTRNLFDAFHKRGHQVQAAFVADKNGKYAFPMPLGIEPIPIPGWWASELGQSSLSSIGSWVAPKGWIKSKWEHLQGAIHWRTHRWHDQRFQKRIERTFARRWAEFDAVYVHYSRQLASRVAQYRPTVLRLPGPPSSDLAPILRKVHVVCANGDALVQAQKVLGDQAIELPIGIDTTIFAPGTTSIRNMLGWTDANYVIGYVGRLIRLKGVDLLAAAFHKISRMLPNARLLIVGSGEKSGLIESILRDEFVEGMVHMESDVPHQRLADWYRAMNLFVMPSRYENFSNAILEALACGVPFLASDVGGNRILAGAVGGHLFVENSADSLAMSLTKISEKFQELKAQGLLGAEYVQRKYTWPASAECLERIITSRVKGEGMKTASQYGEKLIRTGTWNLPTPSGFVEYGFYFYMFYVLVGGVFGIAVNNLASALLLLLLLFCLAEIGSRGLDIMRVVAFPLGCGVAYTFIQLVIFEESLTETVRPFLIWMLTVFLVQSMALRANFLHRFVVVMFLLGLAALPYISLGHVHTSTFQRAGLEKGIGFGQTNAMAEWYGFCTVYFYVLGITIRTNTFRILCWLIALVCLYVVTLTVGRGPLVAIAIAVVIANRDLLKNGFLPILLLACLSGIVIELGIFEETAKFYSARGTEDTGRLAVWPLIIDSFLNSPLIGVGHSHVGAITAQGSFVTPHNGFLYLAQSSGVVPLAFFIVYWLRAARAALRADSDRTENAITCLPLLVFSFLMINAGNFSFMGLWAVVSCAIPLNASVQRQARDLPGQLSTAGVGFEVAK